MIMVIFHGYGVWDSATQGQATFCSSSPECESQAGNGVDRPSLPVCVMVEKVSHV
jgi:hypothetical protein